jgi:hypothetical protein
MSPRAIFNTIAGLILLAALGFGGYAAWSYKRMSQEVAELRPLKDEVRELREQQNALATEVMTKLAFDAAIRSERQDITIRLDKASDEDPVVRAYLSERIPDGVRGAVLNAPERRPIPAADRDRRAAQ